MFSFTPNRLDCMKPAIATKTCYPVQILGQINFYFLGFLRSNYKHTGLLFMCSSQSHFFPTNSDNTDIDNIDIDNTDIEFIHYFFETLYKMFVSKAFVFL